VGAEDQDVGNVGQDIGGCVLRLLYHPRCGASNGSLLGPSFLCANRVLGREMRAASQVV
jgi:hypothetical protein